MRGATGATAATGAAAPAAPLSLGMHHAASQANPDRRPGHKHRGSGMGFNMKLPDDWGKKHPVIIAEISMMIMIGHQAFDS